MKGVAIQMNCQDANDLLHAYADDELDLVTARQLDAHVQTCPACGRVLAAARAVKTAAGNPALYHRAPAELRDRLMATLPIPREPQRSPRVVWRSMAIAATVMIAIAGSWLFATRAGRIDLDAQAVLVAHQRSI